MTSLRAISSTRQALRDERKHLALARREVVRLGDDRRDLGASSRLDHDRCAPGAVGTGDRRRVQRQPDAGRGAKPYARDVGIGSVGERPHRDRVHRGRETHRAARPSGHRSAGRATARADGVADSRRPSAVIIRMPGRAVRRTTVSPSSSRAPRRASARGSASAADEARLGQGEVGRARSIATGRRSPTWQSRARTRRGARARGRSSGRWCAAARSAAPVRRGSRRRAGRPADATARGR